MSVITKMLSTRHAAGGGWTPSQRFLSFAECFEHYSTRPSSIRPTNVPFRAAMNSIHIGTHLDRPLATATLRPCGVNAAG